MAQTPFLATDRLAQLVKAPIYGCAFNQFVKFPSPQMLATVSGNFVHLYELPTNEQIINRGASAEIVLNEKDEFYSLAWCQEPSVNGLPTTKLVVGGETGRIYVVDHKRMVAERELQGLRGMCNEIRTNPQSPTVIAAACNDMAVRVFDIRCDAPLLICGGRWIHSDKVMSVDWSPNGTYLVDSGYDHKIYLWNFSEAHISEHLRSATEALDRGEQPPDVVYTDINQEMAEQIWSPKKKALVLHSPEAFTHDVHLDSVDCVRMKYIKGQMYFVSKSCGYQPTVTFWRFGKWDKSEEAVLEDGKPNRNTMVLSRKKMPHIPMPYFMKFGMDADFRWCVVPGNSGEIQYYALRDREATGPAHRITVHADKAAVRQVAFCDGGHFFVTVGDSGIITRFEKRTNN